VYCDRMEQQHEQQSEQRRLYGRPFPSGTSGNPGGRMSKAKRRELVKVRAEEIAGEFGGFDRLSPCEQILVAQAAELLCRRQPKTHEDLVRVAKRHSALDRRRGQTSGHQDGIGIGRTTCSDSYRVDGEAAEMNVADFETIFGQLVAEHGLSLSTDLAIARALARAMVDDVSDPVRNGEVIVRLKALLPVRVEGARALTEEDLAKLTDDELKVVATIQAKIAGVEPPVFPPEPDVIPAEEYERLLRELDRVESERSLLYGRCDALTRKIEAVEAAATKAPAEAPSRTAANVGPSRANVVQMPQKVFISPSASVFP
jgi:hypothetical protein